MTCYTLEIPPWHPTPGSLVERVPAEESGPGHGGSIRQRSPQAKGRRVSLHIILNKGQWAPDPDASFKSLYDALVHAGALVDDNRQHVELAPVTFLRDPQARGSVIRLEDLEGQNSYSTGGRSRKLGIVYIG